MKKKKKFRIKIQKNENKKQTRINKIILKKEIYKGNKLFKSYFVDTEHILVPAFGPMAIKNMFPGMYDIAEQLTKKWERFGGDVVIDVADNMTRYYFSQVS